ncbi:MAG: class I SAM-dependent methyltransferase [Planctomycetes bacterium]|nr:class I SAM-dependent methyltransferase [Planctomycetota bacterium]
MDDIPAYDEQYFAALREAVPKYRSWNKDQRIVDLVIECACDHESLSALDIGPGFNNLAALFAEAGFRVSTVDLNETRLVAAGKPNWPGVTALEGDGRDLPFVAETIDVITYNSVFEHFNSQDAKRALRQANRALRRGGFLVIYLPSRSWASYLLRRIHRCRMGTDPPGIDDTQDPTHQHWYSLSELMALCEPLFTLQRSMFLVYGTHNFPQLLRPIARFIQLILDKTGLSKSRFIGRLFSFRMILLLRVKKSR